MTDTTVITRATDATTVTMADAITVYATTEATAIVGTGNAGPSGVGVPTGGTDGQVLTKTSATDYATAWEDATGGAGGAAVAYSWRMTEAADRLLWTPAVADARQTYGTTADGFGRDVLSCTHMQAAGPPGAWSQNNASASAWTGPAVTVAAGDVVEFSFVAGWNRTANSIAATDSAPFGDPGYSVAADRNGDLVRIAAALNTDDSFFSYYDVAVMEPQLAWYAGGWAFEGGYYHPLPSMRIVAIEAGTVTPSVTIGPIWGHLAGVTEFVSAAMTVLTPA
jgi:hypothetical protein